MGGRWLSTEYYNDALAHFNLYDPTCWLPTLKLSLTGMKGAPLFLLTLCSALLTLYFEGGFASEEQRRWAEVPLDGHVIMGGAVSFLIVMRSDAS